LLRRRCLVGMSLTADLTTRLVIQQPPLLRPRVRHAPALSAFDETPLLLELPHRPIKCVNCGEVPHPVGLRDMRDLAPGMHLRQPIVRRAPTQEHGRRRSTSA